MKKIFKNETSRLNSLLAILIVLAIAIVFLINALGHSLSEHFPLSADLTANANYDIGDDSKEVLDMLTTDVSIYALATKGSYSGNAYLTQVRKILEQYPKHSSHISLEFIDYTTNPTFTAQYPDLTLTTGDVLVVGPEAVKQIPLANMFNYTYDAEGNLVVSASRAEEAISSAIVSSVTEDPVNVYVLTGNSVSEDRSTLETILMDNNFEVSEADLVTGNFDEAEILILLAPLQDLSEDVLAKLDAFLYNNGEYGRSLIYAADVNQPEMPNMDAFLREWGIEVDGGAIFETEENNVYGYQPYYPFATYTEEEFVAQLKDSSKKVLLPLSRPLNIVFGYKDNKTVTQLMEFAESAGVRPENADSNFRTEDALRWGPMPAMLLSTLAVPNSENTSQVLVLPSVQALSASFMGNTSIANAEYLTAILNTLTARQDAVSIEPKSLSGNILSIATGSASTWGVILCIVIPVGILAAGIIVFLKRRYR
ncbi:MAG: GldG family protein [Lachnospiraceae bacterium]|nr:GldG family protein [Lachnospiraceae bacterium]